MQLISTRVEKGGKSLYDKKCDEINYRYREKKLISFHDYSSIQDNIYLPMCRNPDTRTYDFMFMRAFWIMWLESGNFLKISNKFSNNRLESFYYMESSGNYRKALSDFQKRFSKDTKYPSPISKNIKLEIRNDWNCILILLCV